MADEVRVAVLIDCDNVSWKLSKEILAETAKHGTLGIKRAYGDWSSSYLSGWNRVLSELAIQPIQQPGYTVGKNSSDSALIIDAMDLLYSNNVDVFCIVSSDSDFTRLAMRLRESGRKVYGLGAQTAPVAFRSACDRFTYLEVLTGEPLETIAVRPGADEGTDELRVVARDEALLASVPDIQTILTPAVEATAKEDGWAPLSIVGWYLVNNHPTFDSRNYGFAKIGKLVRHLPFIETKDVSSPNGVLQPWIKLRDDPDA